MKAMILAAILTFSGASLASAWDYGGQMVLGPYQPSPWGGHYYYNPSAPPYRGPAYVSPWYGYNDVNITIYDRRPNWRRR